MFGVICRRRVRVPSKDCNFVAGQFWAPQNGVFVKPFSSRQSPPGVCENDPDKSFTASYLIDSCGLSSKAAISVSERKICYKSPEKIDAVLKLLRDYGFTDSHISNIVTKWPEVLLACPNKTLLPKLEFFRSIGVPIPALAQRLSGNPSILRSSLANYLIPLYNDLKSLLQSEERVVRVFLRAPRASGCSWSEGISSNISMLRERGVPESSIVMLVLCQPYVLIVGKEKLAAYVDRAVEMGFDMSKCASINAIRVFLQMNESALKQKMEVYRRCGWSESDIGIAFLKHPLCMTTSEKKITAIVDFLVNTFNCEPAAIAQCPVLLSMSLEKRIKPRCLVFGILNQNGLGKEDNIAHDHLVDNVRGDVLKELYSQTSERFSRATGHLSRKTDPP